MPARKPTSRIVLTLIMLAGVVNFLDRSSLAVANLSIRGELSLSATQMGVLLSAFSLSYGLMQLPVGPFLDRFGARSVMGMSLCGWSLAQAFAGLASGFRALMLSRVLLGVGEAPFFPASIKLVREFFDPARRGRATAWVNVSTTLGQGLAPPLLTWMLIRLGWRTMFGGIGVLGLVLAAFWLWSLREKQALEPQGAPSFVSWSGLFRHPLTWLLMLGFLHRGRSESALTRSRAPLHLCRLVSGTFCGNLRMGLCAGSRPGEYGCHVRFDPELRIVSRSFPRPCADRLGGRPFPRLLHGIQPVQRRRPVGGSGLLRSTAASGVHLPVHVGARMTLSKILLMVLLGSPQVAMAADQTSTILSGWQMQDVAKVQAGGDLISTRIYKPQGWYRATVPGTVLTTLVDNKVYPEPLFGENMRSIPESLNKTNYWYRTAFQVPLFQEGRHVWLHFGGINYAAEIWLNGHPVGTMRGAFRRGDFDVTNFFKSSHQATLAVLVKPQPHPGVPHEHTQAAGLGPNGGETAIDGPTFLSTIGWDWLPAIRDRDTGIWLPVSLESTGPLTLQNPVVRAELAASHGSADLTVGATLTNLTDRTHVGTLVATITGPGTFGPGSSVMGSPVTGSSITAPVVPATSTSFRLPVRLLPKATLDISLDPSSIPELRLGSPALWWPNGYGPQNLYHLSLRLESEGAVSDTSDTSFGVRKIEYQIAGSDNLALSVNGVPVMVRGGNWGLDEAMKRIPRERLEAQFRLHALANLNLIRNWVGQSTSPDFYDLADKYGLLLWDEFFQPNPNDGPDVTDYETYIANVKDKVLRYRNHPSIAIWCARNEGYPPPELDERLRNLMATLDPTRLYQSSSTDGRGVSSHGPYFWRAPAHFYSFGESFKTEVGSVSIPTIESIQGMMPRTDWETINDDWAQHDFARGAQRGDEYPHVLARRFGPVQNLADFVRKGQMANYEAFRAMYEGRNAGMFKTTTGIITWMSHPAQPSFVWQLYHYDLEPNASLFAVKNAAEPVHIQLNQATGEIEVINNRPEPLRSVRVRVSVYNSESHVAAKHEETVNEVAASSVMALWKPDVPARISPVYFVKLDLFDAAGALLSTNLYWQNVEEDDFTLLDSLPRISLQMSASSRTAGTETILTVELHNPTTTIALMAHLQLRRKQSGLRILPVFFSDNYVSLTPGETRTLTITAATANFQGEEPLLVVDGYNLAQEKVAGAVEIEPNDNADPKHWPAAKLVQ